MTVLFRQASTWLQVWHEPAVVGTAVALFGLAYLLPLMTTANTSCLPGDSSSNFTQTAFAQGLYDVPQDEKFYRDKWIAEADAFYHANPPKEDSDQAPPSMVITASARKPVEPTTEMPSTDFSSTATNPDPAVDHATYATPQMAEPIVNAIETPHQQSMVLPVHAQRWRVATCLAAGLLASLLFVSIWPAAPAVAPSSLPNERQLELVGRGEAIPVRIPSTWIALRPTLRQSARRGVLTSSYLFAAIGAWGIVS